MASSALASFRVWLKRCVWKHVTCRWRFTELPRAALLTSFFPQEEDDEDMMAQRAAEMQAAVQAEADKTERKVRVAGSSPPLSLVSIDTVSSPSICSRSEEASGG